MTEPPDNLVLFDGVCNFCAAAVQFIIRHDHRAVFRFASIQSALGRELYVRHGLNPDDVQTFLVWTRGRALVRSDAAIEVCLRLGGVWKIAWLGKLVPRPVRDWVYSLVARRRYRWFGRTENCLVPLPEIRDRFMG